MLRIPRPDQAELGRPRPSQADPGRASLHFGPPSHAARIRGLRTPLALLTLLFCRGGKELIARGWKPHLKLRDAPPAHNAAGRLVSGLVAIQVLKEGCGFAFP